MNYIRFFFVLYWFAPFLKFGPLPSENRRCAPGSQKVKIIISHILPRGECWSVSRIIISEINNIFIGKWSLHGFHFIDQKYRWTRDNEILNPNLNFKDNVLLTEKGNTKLASSISATINGNNTSPAHGKPIVTIYKNAALFSYKAWYQNTAVCVCNVNVCSNHSPFLDHNYNFNVDVQHVTVSTCGRPRSESCFHNHVNGIKSSKTARGMSVCEVNPLSLYSLVNLLTKKISSKRLGLESIMPHLSRKKLVFLFLVPLPVSNGL